jgi:hypothetical protein
MLLSSFDIRYWSETFQDPKSKEIIPGEMITGADAIDMLQHCTLESNLKSGEFNVATGIRAKDGTMVYEGDLVTSLYPGGPHGELFELEFVVEYKPSRGGFNIDQWHEDVIIIGDKYRGPFLIAPEEIQ